MEIAGVELENLQLENIGSWPPLLRKLVIIAILLITLSFGYFFDLNDLADQLDTTTAERQSLQETYARTHHQVINLDTYRSQVNTVKQSLNLLTQQLPTTNEEAALLEELSQQASSSGLQFQSIKPLPEERKGFYIEQPFELLLRGSYHGFGEFVSNISNLQRIVTIHDFSLRDSTPGSGKLEIVVVVKTYWIAQQEKRL